MGNYAEISLGSFYVGSTKNDFDPAIMQLFRASDKRQDRAQLARTTTKGLPFLTRRWANYIEDETEVDVIYYVAPSRIIKDQLELKGYTLSTAKEAFTRWVRAEAKEWSQRASKERTEFNKRMASLLNELDVEQWLSVLRQIQEAGLIKPESGHDVLELNGTPDYMLTIDWHGYSGRDLSVPLRLALEVCPGSDSLVYDLTDLVLCGYFSRDDDFVSLAVDADAPTAKITVLTEGRSDRWILSESIRLLYPHLFDYFTFMDFESARVEGGAGALAREVKAFAGVGTKNKIVAVFDNDTAGELERHGR